MQSIVDEACATLEAAVRTFDEPRDGDAQQQASESAMRKAVESASRRVETEAAKVAVLMGADMDASPGQVASLLEAFQQAVLSLCNELHKATAGAGATLQGEVRARVGMVVQHCCSMLAALCSPEQRQLLTRLVGVLVVEVRRASKTPVSNRMAVGRRFQTCLAVVADTAREIRDLISNRGELGSEGDSSTAAASAETPASTAPAAGGDSDADSEDFGEEFEEGELRAAALGKAAIDAAHSLLRELMRALLQGQPPDLGASRDAWEEVVRHAAGVQHAVEELGAALYPPQEGQEVDAAAQLLGRCLAAMRRALPGETGDAAGAELEEQVERFDAAQCELLMHLASL